MIRVSPVRVIDEDGSQLGVLETSEALRIAKEKELDLVEVAPNVRPPVCKIIDWGKFQYQQAKKEQSSRTKQKKTEIKGIRIRPSTGNNDLLFKAQQAEKFLRKGNKVKVEIILRGREKAFLGQARGNLKSFVDKIQFSYKIEQDISRQFNGFNIIIAPK